MSTLQTEHKSHGKLNETEIASEICKCEPAIYSFIEYLRIGLERFYFPFGCVLCWTHSRSVASRRRRRWQWPHRPVTAPNTARGMNGRLALQLVSVMGISTRVFGFVNSHALRPIRTNVLTRLNCILAIRCQHFATVERSMYSRSVCIGRPFRRHLPTDRGGVVTMLSLSPRPHVPNTIVPDSMNVNSTRTDDYRCRPTPNIDYPVTISSRTPPDDDLSTDAPIRWLVFAYHVALSIDHETRSIKYHHCMPMHRHAPNDHSIYWSVKIQRE